MANMTLSVPDELLRRMKQFKEVRWSEVARQTFEKRLDDFEAVERIALKSKLTKKDANEIASLINKSVAKRLGIK